jgi:hypothetical protein
LLSTYHGASVRVEFTCLPAHCIGPHDASATRQARATGSAQRDPAGQAAGRQRAGFEHSASWQQEGVRPCLRCDGWATAQAQARVLARGVTVGAMWPRSHSVAGPARQARRGSLKPPRAMSRGLRAVLWCQCAARHGGRVGCRRQRRRQGLKQGPLVFTILRFNFSLWGGE